MDQIQKVATKIRDAFEDIDCVTEDSCPDTQCEMDDNVVIGEDHHRQQWSCEYRVNEGDHLFTMRKLVSLFGPPTKEVPRSDLKDRKVNNWDVGNVHIVQLDNSIELYEEYSKVSRKR